MPPNETTDGNSTTPHVDKIDQLRIPRFWLENPTLWFAQVEAQFHTHSIRSDTNKYFSVVSTLDSRVLQQIADIITTPPAIENHDTLKKHLIDPFSDSEAKQLWKVLKEIELGDKTPSQLLREMKVLAGTKISDEVLKTLWLQRMPSSMQAILSASDSLSLDKMAGVADKISEVQGHAGSHIAAITHHTPPDAKTSVGNAVPLSANIAAIAAPSPTDLAKTIALLNQQVAALTQMVQNLTVERRATHVRKARSRQEVITGQRRSSKFEYGLNAISVDSDMAKTPERLFLSPNYTIVQAQIGTTAILHCEVVDIGESTVSWIRKRDYHLLTVGLQTYSSDKRFFTSNGKNGQDWTLHIRYAQFKDTGLYECQVTTHPASSLFVELELVEAHADIIGGSEKIVKSGSPLRLSCVLRRSTEPPEYIFWYHGDHMINYDLKGGAAVRHGRQGSELLIPRAEMKHAGNYSCVPSNARPANVTVHVLQSEKPAAMQHDSKGGSAVPYVARHVFNMLLLGFLTFVLPR